MLMPELPEVENQRLGLSKNLNSHLSQKNLNEIQFFRKNLRFDLPQQELKKIKNHRLLKLSRRGKFLIFNFENLSFYSHLGMTGHWRIENLTGDKLNLKKHDHVLLKWASWAWVYNDPRRFGYLDLITPQTFKHFGPDPILDPINPETFYEQTRKISLPVKSWIMDQKNILGVGNIYASEALFNSKIHPLYPTNLLELSDWQNLSQNIHKILNESIRLGGSSLKDYRKVDGSLGGFQNVWKVYNRFNKNCYICESPIKEFKLSGRATYFCPSCQKA